MKRFKKYGYSILGPANKIEKITYCLLAYLKFSENVASETKLFIEEASSYTCGIWKRT